MLLNWLLLGWLFLGCLFLVDDRFGQVKIDGHFSDFEQIKNLPYSKTPLGETGCLRNFLGYLSTSLALHHGFSDLWRSPPALSSTPTTFSCLLFLFFQASSFFIRPVPTQSVRLPLVTYPWLCSTYVTCRIPYHASSHQVLPTTPLAREAEDFPRGGNHSKHVPLLIYLAWLQPIYCNAGFIFLHVKLINNFACGEKFSKKEQWVSAISFSNHSNHLLEIGSSKNAFQNCYYKDIFD